MKLKHQIISFLNRMTGKPYPCGRTKSNSYLCCVRPMTENNVVYNSDRTEVFCKYCGHTKMLSSFPIKNVDDIWNCYDSVNEKKGM